MTFDPEAPMPADAPTFGQDIPPEAAGLVLLPVPFDATASYGRNAAAGPEAIRSASHQLDLFCRHAGRPYERGICSLPIPGDVEAWNTQARAAVDAVRDGDATRLSEVNGLSMQVQAAVRAEAEQHLAAGRAVAVIGGDHSAPLGSIQAHAAAFPEMSILHVDAHADLRDAYEGFTQSHASIMHNVLASTGIKRLVQVGIRDFAESEYRAIEQSNGRVVTFFDDALDGATPWTEVVESLSRDVYISFDIDGLDPALCPNTGTPVPGGLTFRDATALIRAVRESGRRLVGFDLCEVAPGPDADAWDGNVGARILYALAGQLSPR